MKYGEWLNLWLCDYVKPVEKQKTYENYSDVVRLRLLPRFGECELNSITPNGLQHYITELVEEGNLKTGGGLAGNTIELIVSVIRNSLKRAYNLGYVERYVGDKVKTPKKAEREVVCFTKAEQKVIEQEIMRRAKPKMYGIILCLYTGLRIGELLALKWSDVNFSDRLLTVSKTCHDDKDEEGNYRKRIESPKTGSSFRSIPIPHKLLPLLYAMYDVSEDGFVVSDRNRPVKVRSYQRSYELLLRELGIPHKKFHALRHTFATRAIECGVDVRTLSEILGHKSPAVTLKLYVHSLFEHKRDMMELVGDLLDRKMS